MEKNKTSQIDTHTKNEIYMYLQTQSLMSIATFGDEPWPAIVYFVVDKKLNLYFLSSPDSEHGLNILKDDRVACTIYDSTQKFEAAKIGVQYTGTAKVVGNIARLKWAVKLWNKIIASKSDFKLSLSDLISANESKIYMVSPKKVKYFSTLEFDDEYITLKW